MKVALVQMNSQDNLAANLRMAENLVKQARRDEGAELVVLPEYFAYLDDDPGRRRRSGQAFDDIRSRLAALAQRNGIYLHAGSIVEPSPERAYNTSLVFDPEGKEIARYRKIHLFDIDSPNGVIHRESSFIAPGSEVALYRCGALTIGCAICYDLRFPELFRKLRDLGADVIVLPAAFTLTTGKDHWEVLLRARAIDSQTYILAAGQAHTYAEGRRASWGHSMVVDPWGRVLAEASDMVGVICVQLDMAYLSAVRNAIPIANHHMLP